MTRKDILDAAGTTAMPVVQPEQQRGRAFKGIVVEYPSYSIYPEYKGKPYFSIKYTKNGQEFIGYSTYKPKILSKYLKKYFISSAQSKRKTGKWTPGREIAREMIGDCITAIFYEGWTCSECGCLVEKEREPWYKYCPNCGAKMEGSR